MSRFLAPCAALAALLLAGCSADSDAPGNNDIPALEADNAASETAELDPVRVDAGELAAAYRQDYDGAARRFGKRHLIVRGIVEAIDNNEAMLDVVLGDKAPGRQVRVVPSGDDPSEERNAAASHVGRMLSVSCSDVDGVGGDVVLHECVGFDT